MLMTCAIALAAGLNPYVTALVVAALLGFATRVELAGPLEGISPVTWRTATAVAAILAGLDVTLGKLRGRFDVMRLASLGASLLMGGAGAVIGAGDRVPAVFVAIAGGAAAGLTSIVVSRAARRWRANPKWLGLGHVPVLMSSTVVATVVVPLSLVSDVAAATLAVAGTAGNAVIAFRGTPLVAAAVPPPTG